MEASTMTKEQIQKYRRLFNDWVSSDYEIILRFVRGNLR
jgi:hypothetical protein